MQRADMNDLEIIELIRKKSHHAAIGKLYDYFPKIKSLIRSKGGTNDDAKDVFQESIIIFCRKASADSFQLTASIGTYLYSVGWHLWKDTLKKRNRNIIMDELTGDKLVSQDDLQEHFEKEEKFNYLDKILLEISEKCQKIFRLYYFQKQSMKEIAQQLGFGSEQTAKNQKYKCLERAKEMAKQMVSVH